MAVGGALGLIWLPVTPRHFAWQAWHKLTSTVVLRGKRGTNSPLRHFAWQVWHKLTFTIVLRGRRGNLTSTFVLRGRRGTDSTGWRAWSDLVARDAAALCVADVAQSHIYHRFAWQGWHKLTSTIVWRGRCGTDGTGWRAWSDLVARDAAALCVAGVAQTHIYQRFAWQTWHKLTSTIVLRGKRGTDGSGCRAWSDLVAFHIQLCHTLSFTDNFVTHHLSHTTLSHTIFHIQLCHTPSFPHNFVTHHLSHTTLSHTIFHIQLCHTLSFTHNFVTHHLSHTTLSHTFFHIQVCHIPSFKHNFVNHHLSHTTLSHTIFHTHLCHTPSFTYNFVTHLLSHITSTVVLLGRRGTYSHLRHFAWQVWHKFTSTIVLRGRRGTDGSGWRAWFDLVARDAAAL